MVQCGMSWDSLESVLGRPRPHYTVARDGLAVHKIHLPARNCSIISSSVQSSAPTCCLLQVAEEHAVLGGQADGGVEGLRVAGCGGRKGTRSGQLLHHIWAGRCVAATSEAGVPVLLVT